MKKIDSHFSDEIIKSYFTNNIGGMFTNFHGVTFTSEFEYPNPNNRAYISIASINVSCPYPGDADKDGDTDLDLFVEFSTIASFAYQFSIKTKADLGRIKPKQLLQDFHEGKVSVFCNCREGHVFFSKKEEDLFVDDDNGSKYKVLIPLIKASDFIKYTKNYFTPP